MGAHDGDSWRDTAGDVRCSERLLFDANFKPKGDYYGVFDTLVATSTRAAAAAR